MATSFDHVGVLVRSVEDVALLLSVLAVHDPDDPYCAGVPADDYLAAVSGDLPAPRLGLVRGWFANEADAETRLLMEETAQELANAGAVVEEVDPGVDFARSYASHRIMQESEMAVWHTPLYTGNESLYGPRITVYIQNGFSHTARDYVAASDYRREVQRLTAEAMEQVDALIMPTASGPAPRDRTQTGDTRFQSPWSYTGFPSISVPHRARQRRPAARRATRLRSLPGGATPARCRVGRAGARRRTQPSAVRARTIIRHTLLDNRQAQRI